MPDWEVIPDWAQDIVSGLEYPVRDRPAVGGVATWDGKRFGPQIYSGGREAGREGIRETNERIEDGLIWNHVELKLAEQLRHPSAPKDVVLFIDRPPCPGSHGCATNLKHLIPRGKTITIFIAPKNGPVRPWGRVEGTGRYLRSE